MDHREINRRNLSFCSVACMFKKLLQGKGFGDTEGRSRGLGLAIIDEILRYREFELSAI